MASELPLKAAFGSDDWTSGSQYACEKFIRRIEYFKTTFKEDELVAYASSLRDRACTVSAAFESGTHNLVKKITFDDGVEWLARMRLPVYECFLDSAMPVWESESARDMEKIQVVRTMENEIVTMQFVRLHTRVPVPEVHSYNLDHNNAVGFPFIIMDYIPGISAVDLARLHDPKGDIPTMYQETFFRQLASVMVELASLRFTKIGSIIRGPLGSFTIGPFVNTGSGPYVSAADFYEGYPQSLLERHYNDQDDLGQFDFVHKFQNLAQNFPASEEHGSSFGLMHGDLGAHNVIVDEEFNILSVIDWDSATSVPNPFLHCFPGLSGLDLGIPVTSAHPNNRKFAALVDEVQGERAGPVVLRGAKFFSKEALTCNILDMLYWRDKDYNEDGVADMKWLAEHDAADFAKLYQL